MSTVDRTRPPAPAAVRAFEFPRIQRDRLDNGLAVLTARHGAPGRHHRVGRRRRRRHRARRPRRRRGAHAGSARGGDDDPRRGPHRPRLRAARGRTRLRRIVGRRHCQDHRPRRAPRTGHGAPRRSRQEPGLPGSAPLADARRAPRLVRQRKKRPGALAGDALIRHIFAPGVPYARPSFGTRETVEATSRDDVEAFYRERYRPNAAALLFVGDVDAETARRLAERHFADWTAGDVPATDFDVAPGVESRTIFVVDRPGSVQSEIRIGDVGVSRHPRLLRLVVMNAILGGVFTSRLNMNLRERHGFTYGARSASPSAEARAVHRQAAVATDVTARALEEAIREIELLREDGATEAEVENARDYLSASSPSASRPPASSPRSSPTSSSTTSDDYFLQYRDRIAPSPPTTCSASPASTSAPNATPSSSSATRSGSSRRSKRSARGRSSSREVIDGLELVAVFRHLPPYTRNP